MMPRLFLLVLAATLILGWSFRPPTPITVTQLGEQLFFDPILSADSTLSCAGCHLPAFGFADTLAFSRGVGGRLGRRNTQSVQNMTARPYFFYDGRAATLETQVLMPIQDTLEMRSTPEQVQRRLRGSATYGPAFKKLFGRKANMEDLAIALATYVRTLETSNSDFDHWMKGKPSHISESAVRGRRLFMTKGKCFDCHFTPDFTGDEFRNIGLYTGRAPLADTGRFGITHDSSDLGKFKVPGLRNVALTAPYMHNGMFRSLEEVIDFYDQPQQIIPDAVGRDTLMARPLDLSVEEKADLKAFLESLTDK